MLAGVDAADIARIITSTSGAASARIAFAFGPSPFCVCCISRFMSVGGSGNGAGRRRTARCCAIVPGRAQNLSRISGVKRRQFGGWAGVGKSAGVQASYTKQAFNLRLKQPVTRKSRPFNFADTMKPGQPA